VYRQLTEDELLTLLTDYALWRNQEVANRLAARYYDPEVSQLNVSVGESKYDDENGYSPGGFDIAAYIDEDAYGEFPPERRAQLRFHPAAVFLDGTPNKDEFGYRLAPREESDGVREYFARAKDDPDYAWRSAQWEVAGDVERARILEREVGDEAYVRRLPFENVVYYVGRTQGLGSWVSDPPSHRDFVLPPALRGGGPAPTGRPLDRELPSTERKLTADLQLGAGETARVGNMARLGQGADARTRLEARLDSDQEQQGEDKHEHEA